MPAGDILRQDRAEAIHKTIGSIIPDTHFVVVIAVPYGKGTLEACFVPNIPQDEAVERLKRVCLALLDALPP